MSFSIYSIFTAAVLLLNALAILSEARLLPKLGIRSSVRNGNEFAVPEDPFDGGAGHRVTGASSFRAQIATLLSSVRTLLRWPLIFVNVVLIFFALILG